MATGSEVCLTMESHCNPAFKWRKEKKKNPHKGSKNSDRPTTTEALSVSTTCLLKAKPPRQFHRKRHTHNLNYNSARLFCQFRGTATNDTENLSSTSLSSCTQFFLRTEGKREEVKAGRLHPRFPPSLNTSSDWRKRRKKKKRRWTMNHRLCRTSIILPQQLLCTGEHWHLIKL